MNRFAVFFCALTIAAAAHSESLQKWTAQNGEEITAEFVTIKDGNAYFMKDGLTNGIPLKWLADESRERAETLLNQREKARIKGLTPAMKAATIEPLVYTDGRVKHDLLFSSPKMDVYLSKATGHAEIFVKEDGKFLSEPLSLGFSVRERIGERVRSVLVVGEPVVEETGKNTIILRRMHEYDVKTELYFSFDGSSLSVGYMLFNPNPSEHLISSELGVYVRPSFYMERPSGQLDFVYYTPRLNAAGVPFSEVEQLMGGWTVDFAYDKKIKDIQTSFPYLKSLKQFPHGPASITLNGGPHGKTLLKYLVWGWKVLLCLVYTQANPLGKVLA